MRVNNVIQLMKQMSGKIGSSIYASVPDQTNPHHISFLRQLQRDINKSDILEIPLTKLKVVVFDLETTGFSPEQGDHILSIGAVKTQGDHLQDDNFFYSLVHSSTPLSQEIMNLTGISEVELLNAPPLAEVLDHFFHYIKGHILVAHHATHEKKFMQDATWNLSRSHFQHRIVDTSFLIRIIDPYSKLIRLEDCCSHCGIEISNRHHALGDAKLTAQLWNHYLKQVQELGYETLRDVYEQLGKLK